MSTYSAHVRKFLSPAADALWVIIFVIIGLHSHGHTESIVNIVEVASPFLAGLALGWLIVVRIHLAGVSLRDGLLLWLATVLVGQTIRVIVGQGTAFTFILVSLLVLGAGFLGWRTIYGRVASRSKPTRAR